MRCSALLSACLVLFGGATAAQACGGYNDFTYTLMLADDSADRDQAIAMLRDEGPSALHQLFRMRDDLVRVAATGDEKRQAAAKWSLRRLDRAIDQVGGQRYCAASRLYWYTDLAQAQAAAKHAGKPILSLRMLGNLTDEYSCANSRFFRTTLYANETIANTLRENFILHWKSVRPVPVVTVDFGDGRVLKRTLTGNSAHYVLAPDGRPLDALPGLYHPAAFADWLERSQQLAKSYAEAEVENRDTLLAAYHAERLQKVLAAWQSDLVKIGAAKRPARAEVAQQAVAAPKAAAAMGEAVTKRRIEAPLLRFVATEAIEQEPVDIADNLGESQWPQIAAHYRYKVDLDDASEALIERELPDNADSTKIIRALEESIGVDTVRNEYRLHTRIHQWFAEGNAGLDAGVLNERIYTELFLTPSSDPWLGLAPSDVYTALGNAGVVAGP